MNLPIDKKSLVRKAEFNPLVDLFLGAWASFEMTLDFAIGKFLKISHAQTHLITAGMAFGKRANLLADLVGRSDHPRKAEILGTFNRLCGMPKREIFVHSLLRPNDGEGHFLARSANGQFKTKSPNFTKDEVMDQLRAFAVAGSDFHIALGVTDADIQSFAAAAHSMSGKPKTGRDDRSLSAAE